MDIDEFKTIAANAESEIKVKGSRFIAFAAPVLSRQEAEKIYAQRAKLFSDATHNCYGYRVGCGDQSEWRLSDDGEPAGTAGKPIIQVIDSNALTNVIVIVTRYFGGSKLGIGGLKRAYSGAAAQVLNSCSITTQYVTVEFDINFPYHLTNAVMREISSYKGEIVAAAYQAETKLAVRIRKSYADAFRSALRDTTAGKVSVNNPSYLEV